MAAHDDAAVVQTHGDVHQAHGAEGHGHDHGGPRRSIWLRGSWVRAIWLAIVLPLIVIGISLAIRDSLGWRPVNAQVVSTLALIFSGLGFTIGIGCFDAWWGYLIGAPTPEH